MSNGYLIEPTTGPGRGVLVLHSWWGLTPFFRRTCDRLADVGYTAFAPDLLDGETPATPDEAEQTLAALDVNSAADLAMRSAGMLRGLSSEPNQPIAVIGFSMGASWALWLSARAPASICSVVSFYGTQNIDFAESQAAYLGHFAEFDQFATEDDVNEMEAHLRILDLDVEFHRYAGASHWFFESDRSPAYNSVAAELAWTRTLDFLGRRFGAASEAETDELQ